MLLLLPPPLLLPPLLLLLLLLPMYRCRLCSRRMNRFERLQRVEE